MADFVHFYLQQRFSLPKMVAEWAYNLRDVCPKYGASDDYIGLFWAILDGQVRHQCWCVCVGVASVCVLVCVCVGVANVCFGV